MELEGQVGVFAGVADEAGFVFIERGRPFVFVCA